MVKIFTILLLAGCWVGGYGQDDWSLESTKDGIAVYTRTYPDSKFKAIRVEFELETTLSRLVAVLLDVNAAANWVYATKSSVLLKQVSPTELYYYSEVNVPWPFNNRDFIARLIVTQDSVSHVVTVDGPTIADYLPVKKNIVRVAQSEGRWVICPVGNSHIRVEYTLHMDPGGDIPAWLFNLFAAKGPTESIRNLKRQLGKPAYAQASFPFIIE